MLRKVLGKDKTNKTNKNTNKDAKKDNKKSVQAVNLRGSIPIYDIKDSTSNIFFLLPPEILYPLLFTLAPEDLARLRGADKALSNLIKTLALTLPSEKDPSVREVRSLYKDNGEFKYFYIPVLKVKDGQEQKLKLPNVKFKAYVSLKKALDSLSHQAQAFDGSNNPRIARVHFKDPYLQEIKKKNELVFDIPIEDNSNIVVDEFIDLDLAKILSLPNFNNLVNLIKKRIPELETIFAQDPASQYTAVDKNPEAAQKAQQEFNLWKKEFDQAWAEIEQPNVSKPIRGRKIYQFLQKYCASFGHFKSDIAKELEMSPYTFYILFDNVTPENINKKSCPISAGHLYNNLTDATLQPVTRYTNLKLHKDKVLSEEGASALSNKPKIAVVKVHEDYLTKLKSGNPSAFFYTDSSSIRIERFIGMKSAKVINFVKMDDIVDFISNKLPQVNEEDKGAIKKIAASDALKEERIRQIKALLKKSDDALTKLEEFITEKVDEAIARRSASLRK